ncbi:MAG TPA: hypothetical protein VFK05_31220 [Polyangiaceae bacterium]|nr:hypothetical protein [Polyangiaceae bacterium]
MPVERVCRVAARAPCCGRTGVLLLPFVLLACVPNCRGTSRNVSGGAVSAAPKNAPLPTATAVDVCVGKKRSCALASDGRVACWGDNAGRWLTEGIEQQIAAPMELADLAPAVSLQCPSNGVCVRSRAGTISCRVENAHSLLRPALPAPAMDFVALGSDGCAILENRSVVCFETLAPLGKSGSNPPLTVERALGASAFFNSGSASRACVKRPAAPSLCFTLAHPGVPTVRVGERSPPQAWLEIEDLQEVPSDAPVVSPSPQTQIPAGATRVALSEHHGCAVVEGKVECWGRASDGQLGDGTRYFHDAPVLVPDLKDVISLSVANTSACALKRGGSLVCWGGNHEQGTAAFTPTEVATSEPFSEVALIPRASETLICARGNSGWQCRVGDNWRPLQSPSADVRSFKAGHFVTADNRSWEWGQSALQFPPEPDYFALAGLRVNRVAPDGRCAVSTNGKLVCSTCRSCAAAEAKARPETIEGEFVDVASTVRDPVARADIVCALTKAATIRCFQLRADSSDRSKTPPVPFVEPSIESLSSIIQLEAADTIFGPVLTCALSATGAVNCWGSGEFGQLGVPPVAHRASAQRVPGLPRVVELGVGTAFACARAESGAVLCWGSNRDGSAPNGSPGERTKPVTLAWPMSSIGH